MKVVCIKKGCTGTMLPFDGAPEGTRWVCTTCGTRAFIRGVGDFAKLIIDKIPVEDRWARAKKHG